MEVGSELLLSEDGTFQFALAYGALDLTAEGTWRQEGDTVILNAKAGTEPLFKLHDSASSNDPHVRITIKGPGGDPAERVDVILKTAAGSSHEVTDRKGQAVFQDIRSAQSVSFHVPVYDAVGGPFPLDAAHNEFEFVINPEAIGKVPFRNERLKIQGNTLDLRFFDPDKAMVYRKK